MGITRRILWRTMGLAVISAGIAVLVELQPLTLHLIHLVGEERALGSNNVVRQDDGSVMMTNPGTMALWSVPIVTVAAILLVSGAIVFVMARPERRGPTKSA